MVYYQWFFFIIFDKSIYLAINLFFQVFLILSFYVKSRPRPFYTFVWRHKYVFINQGNLCLMCSRTLLPYRRLPNMRTLLCITSIVMLFLRRVVKWLLKTLSSLYCFLLSIIYSPYTVQNFSRNTYMKISNNVDSCFTIFRK